MKKKLLTALSLVAVAAVSIVGTIAYLTSEDQDVNVMTMGNVKIEQHEYERVVDENGDWVSVDTSKVNPNYGYKVADKIQPFTQGKPALPAVYQDGKVKWDDRTSGHQQIWNEAGALGSNQLFDDSVKNVIDKFVFVENTGKTDAYYRTIIAIESPSDNTADIHMNLNANERFTAISGSGSSKSYKVGYTELDGVRYAIYDMTYNKILTPGEISRPSMLQVFLDPSATNEDCATFGDTWDILVLSQAVQANGFASAQEALNEGFGKVNDDNVKAWFEGSNIPVTVDDADALVDSLESGKDVVFTDDIKIDPANMSNAYGTTGINVKNGQTIDGNGHTIDIKGAGGTWDSGINTTGGLIKNLTVTGSFRGVFINHNSDYSERVILENVTIDGTTYTISCDQGKNQGFTAIDSTFNGWTSYAATLGDADFTGCNFGEGNGYSYLRAYAPSTFVNCEFEKGYEIDARAVVTFENCTLDGKTLTADNLATLVTSNIQNATVK